MKKKKEKYNDNVTATEVITPQSVSENITIAHTEGGRGDQNTRASSDKADIEKANTEKEPKTLRERIAATKTTRWVRFGIVSLIFLLWVAWLGSWWVAIFIFLLFDIYITGYIPLTWWKKSKSKVTLTIMSWVDAIVYALVLVYFVFTFIGQNYQIPSSSLEKSLLVGDYLVVNKLAYGPRVPMTPVHFPLVQNTFPIINTKSYTDWPQFKYHRLKGFGNVERGDIVVFNFPAGDTVALKVQNPDYYTLCTLEGRNKVWSDKATYGDIIYRPVDRRENYVKRAVGLPGERIKIVDDVIYINGEALPQPKDVQFNYYIQTTRPITPEEFDALGISPDDRVMIVPDAQRMEDYINTLNFLVGCDFPIDMENGAIPNIYRPPLTSAMLESLKANPNVVKMMKVPAFPGQVPLFPMGLAEQRGWTWANYGDNLWIPAKGSTIALTPENWVIYNRCIRNYEGHHDAYLGSDGKVYIDGKPQEWYTFAMDYYFMMGDNRDNSLDSRFWGFVPEDHIVGRPELILISFDKDRSIFNGGIRWNRILRRANHDKL